MNNIHQDTISQGFSLLDLLDKKDNIFASIKYSQNEYYHHHQYSTEYRVRLNGNFKQFYQKYVRRTDFMSTPLVCKEFPI